MTSWIGSSHRKPSQIASDVIEGRLHHDDAPEAVQSWLSLQYYHKAKEILGLREDEMKKSLTGVPETCRDEVRKQMLKLWRER